MSANKTAARLPWSVCVALSDIPEGGRRFELTADEATRAEIARIANLRSLPRLQATFDVARQGEGLRVDGAVSATVGQNCVVTLDPVDNEVREEINLVFVPSRAPLAGEDDDEDEFDEIDPDEPETLEGDSVDLGVLATEFLMLGIDPYPRKPGAVFEQPAPEDETDHPFARLAALKKGPDSKE